MARISIKTPRHCPRCKQWISQELIDKQYVERSKNLAEAMERMRAEGKSIGRKRRLPYDEIYAKILAGGRSLRSIAREYECRPATIEHIRKVKRREADKTSRT